MSKKRLVPKRRFKGFTDDWEQRKLGEVAEITMGQSPDGSTYSGVPSGNILIQGNADLQDGWVIPRVWTTQVTKKAEAGDLIMSVRAPAGTIGKTAYDAVIGRGVAAIKGNEFMYQMLLKMDNDGYWKAFSSGSTFESLNSDNIRNAEIIIPKEKEQQLVGSVLNNLDHLITLHQRKLEKAKSLKKSLLSEMFPAEGERKPKRRFPGFTGDWEQRKAKDVCSIGTGKSDTQDQVADGAYPFYIRSDIPVRSDKYLYDCEAVITIGDGNIGKVFHYVNGKFDLHQRCYKMADFRDIWGHYFYYFFSTKFYDRAMRMTAKATVDSVRLEMISEMDILKPTQLAEQTIIAEFFSHLDHLITLHQRKLEKLQNLKKAYLNEMFI
jgi:type I restriction enzyme S subunit